MSSPDDISIQHYCTGAEMSVLRKQLIEKGL